MKWVLIIMVTTHTGGFFGGYETTQQEVGPFSTEENCQIASEEVPKEIRRLQEVFNLTGENYTAETDVIGKITTFCVPIQ